MIKQVIVVVTGLNMGKGKIASQASHASYSSAKKSDKEKISKWESEGQKKVVLKADKEVLKKIIERCENSDICFSVISDAGKTQIPSGSVTAIGIGPDDEKKIDKITGNLKLL